MTRRLETGYLAGPKGGLYASVHAGEQKRGGVLLLPPYGEERKCACRLLVRLADRLAETGYIVLRVDYSGTGESAGSLAETSLDDWRRDLAAAWSFLHALAGQAPIAAIGCRLGANLALELGDPAITRYILWEPLPSGREFLDEITRRKQVKEMMTAGQAASQAGDCQAAWNAGLPVDFDGFPMSAAFAAQLRRLDLLESVSGTARQSLMVCHITGAKRQYGTWASLADLAAGSSGMVYKVVHEKPFWGRVDIYDAEELLRETIAFVG